MRIRKQFKSRLRRPAAGTIRSQMLMGMMLVALLAIVILGLSIFTLSKRTIERNFQSAHLHNLGVSSSIIDIQLGTMVELARTLLVEEGFMGVLSRADAGDAPYFDSISGLILEHSMRDIAAQSSFIQSMAVISDRGNIRFYSRLSGDNGLMRHNYTEGEILESVWVEEAEKARGKEVFLEKNVLFEDGEATFSMVKKLIAPGTGKGAGYLVINLRKSMLDEAFGKGEEAYVTNRYLILRRGEGAAEDREGLVYFNGDEESRERIVDAYLAGERESRYLFSSVKNDISGWEIINVVETAELGRDSGYIGWLALVIGGAMLVVCMLLSNGISGRILRPLVLLEETIRQVGEGNYQTKICFDESEIGRLGTQFQNMVNNNIKLREQLLQSEIKEKEAELLLLQSQINPHFLYNTLDALYFRALLDGADDVAEMVEALSDTFRLSLNKGDKLIRVEDEMARIRAYVKLQQMRYGDRFRFGIDLEEELLPLRMLGFVLQPLVENALYHGLEPDMEKGYISIEGYLADGDMIFHVRDNGVGIADMEEVEKGYGIRNIRERIRLFYGEERDILFDSRPGGGTTVTLILPVLAEEEERAGEEEKEGQEEKEG